MLRQVIALLALIPYTLAFVTSPSAFSTIVNGVSTRQCSGLLRTSMVSDAKKSYLRQFGYPAVKAGKHQAEAKVTAVDNSKKGEGWVYRAPKATAFEDGQKFWTRIESNEKNAKIDVSRYHSTKSS